MPCEIGLHHSSYGAGTDSSGGSPDPQDLEINISGRDVLVVEDIIDSAYLRRTLGARKRVARDSARCSGRSGARSRFPCGTSASTEPTFSAIGYGLDFAERYRASPILRLHPDLVPNGTSRAFPTTTPVLVVRCDTPWGSERRERRYPSGVRESFLQKRALPPGRHRAARLLGEPDAHAARRQQLRRSRLAADPGGTEERRRQRGDVHAHRQSITAVLDSGQKVKVNYPSPQSQAQFQNVLEEHNVKFDSKGIGTSLCPGSCLSCS